jgi:hypothetical protein
VTERPISQLLPGRLLHAALKEDVIAYLQAAPLAARERRRLFRRWCEFTNQKPRRQDLERVAPSKAREVQLGLEL